QQRPADVGGIRVLGTQFGYPQLGAGAVGNGFDTGNEAALADFQGGVNGLGEAVHGIRGLRLSREYTRESGTGGRAAGPSGALSACEDHTPVTDRGTRRLLSQEDFRGRAALEYNAAGGQSGPNAIVRQTQRHDGIVGDQFQTAVYPVHAQRGAGMQPDI